MAPISVTLQQRDPPVGVVTLIGEHDAFSATRLENELAVLLDDGTGVVVDLGFTLVLSNDAYTQVHRLLDLTGLGAAFATLPTLDRAVAASRAGQAGAGRV